MSIRRRVNGNAMLIKCFCSWAGGISATGGLIKARYGSAGLDGNQIVTMRAMLARSSPPPTRSFEGFFPRVVSRVPLRFARQQRPVHRPGRHRDALGREHVFGELARAGTHGLVGV